MPGGLFSGGVTVLWHRAAKGLLNLNDVVRVKSTLTHQVYGSGDFIQRWHDVLYDPSMKLSKFGRFCALERYGTVDPTKCPPVNGRMAKALRYLGFGVSLT